VIGVDELIVPHYVDVGIGRQHVLHPVEHRRSRRQLHHHLPRLVNGLDLRLLRDQQDLSCLVVAETDAGPAHATFAEGGGTRYKGNGVHPVDRRFVGLEPEAVAALEAHRSEQLEGVVVLTDLRLTSGDSK